MTKISNLYTLTNYISANSSGNVVIAAPASGYALDVTGTGRFTGAFTGTSASFSGNVGLGATSSAYKLRILTDNTLDNGLYLSGGTGSTNHSIYIENKAGTAEYFAVRGDGQIRLNASGTGNVLINLTSALGGKLDVQGDNNNYAAIFKGGTTTGQSYGPYFRAGTNSSDIAFQVKDVTEANTYFRVRGDGLVGIGTGSPASGRKLTVAGGAQFTYTDNGGASFNIVPGTNGQDGCDFNLSYYTGTGYGPLTFTLGGSLKMTLDASGRLGINTTPTTGDGMLQVIYYAGVLGDSTKRRGLSVYSTSAENADQPGVILGYDTSGAGIVAARTNSSGQPLAFWTYNGSSWGERMRIASDGTKYFGTYNGSRFQMNGAGENFYQYTNTYYIWGLYNDANNLSIESAFSGSIIFRTAAQTTSSSPQTATPRMTITSGGNVLINKTNNTGDKLQVSDGTNMYNFSYDINGPYLSCVNNANTVYKRLSFDSNDAVFYGSGTERIRITNAGVLNFNGNSTETSVSDKLSIGYSNGSYGWIQTWGGTPLYFNRLGNAVYAGTARIDNNSDARVKDNVQSITGALSKVLSMNGKKFHMLDEPEDKIRLGFIAQELQGVVDELVIESDRTQTLPNGEVIENILGLETWGSSWAALLVEAIKELSAKVTALENK